MRPNESEVVSLQEAARLYGCGLTTMKGFVQIGAIPHFHVGRKVNLLREDVIAYRESAMSRHMVTHRKTIRTDTHRRSARLSANTGAVVQ